MGLAAFGFAPWAAIAAFFKLPEGRTMPVGTVKWFDCKKGFGFLVDDGGNEVFIHYTVIEGEGFRRLRDGEKVEYEASTGPKGILATKVRRIDPPPVRSRPAAAKNPAPPAPEKSS
jgi:cold shock CspA family protein